MNSNSNPLAVFEQEAPEVSKAFDQLIEALKKTTGLDAKTKQLIYIGIKSSVGMMQIIVKSLLTSEIYRGKLSEISCTNNHRYNYRMQLPL